MEKHSRRAITFLLDRAEDMLIKEETHFAKWLLQKKHEQDNFQWQLDRLNTQFDEYSTNIEKRSLEPGQYQNLLDFDIKVHKVYKEWSDKYDSELKFRNNRLLTLRGHVKKWETIISRIDARDEIEVLRLEKKLADEIATNMWLRQKNEKEQDST